MNIWNIDAWQRQRYLTYAESCFFMSLSDKYLICLIALCCYRISLPPWYPLSDLKEITSPSPLRTFLKENSIEEITPPCNAINTCILYRLCFKQHGLLLEDLIGYTHASFHHVATFSCRNIAFHTWWLRCNSLRSKWPKTFCGRCMHIVPTVPLMWHIRIYTRKWAFHMIIQNLSRGWRSYM